MEKNKVKEFAIDILVDIVGNLLIAIGVYNFAANSGFPVAGISGIAMIFYHLFGLPIGTMTIILNIPIVIMCYKLLGRGFLLRSLKTMIIAWPLMDYVAPMLPVYSGDRMLSAICVGVFSGLGYAMIYMRNTSTGGADFIIMSVRALRPHLSIGKITFITDVIIVGLGGMLFGDVDSIIYGLILTYILSVVVDKVMYGIDAGKMTLVVTDHGHEVAKRIDELTQRGSTFLRGVGSYSGEEKLVVMCACSNKEMHMVQKAVKEVDENAFLVTMESNEVRGEGFKPH
ncbi:MAG: YitT family protein [Lachnospiraceae bacterium]|nr:YitT family protein [Lachnospiraceae bacterium]MDO4452122.1 YitT family protein [Lachnospiraceae bacterium]MDU3180788.1 YitT family protein [Lachnospiraceae bacterium]